MSKVTAKTAKSIATGNNGGPDFFTNKLNGGLKLLSDSEKSGNKGVQTLAYSVMLGHALLIDSDSEIPNFKALLEGGKAVVQLCNKLLELGGKHAPETRSKTEGRSIDHDTKVKAYRALQANMKRAINLAAILKAEKIDESFFNESKGIFSINPELIMEYNQVAGGLIGKLASEGQNILLDNTSYYVSSFKDGKEVMLPINASVSQVIKAFKSHITKGETKPKAGVKAGQGEVKTSNSFESSLKEVYEVIHESKGESDLVKWSDLDDKTRSYLSAIEMFIMDCKAHDKMTDEEMRNGALVVKALKSA